MEQRFDRVITRKGTNCVKFDTAADRGYPEDVLPLFIADMDFQVPESVQEALTADVQKGIFGYSIFDKGYFPAIARWMETNFGWRPEENWLVTTPGVVFAIATAVRSLTEIGDGVLIQPPVYPPFFSTVTENGRRLVESPLVQENGRYEIDFADFEEKVRRENVKLFLLCSPHNPVGRVWTLEELQKIGRICKEYGVKVVSDEIHMDFALPGHLHIPFLKACPAQWRCTMIWSAYLGLPLSLMGVGAALALDKQKLSEGKELIRYFCQPCAATKANGGRTRNLPQDAPEKWTLFKAYNLRDVETEMGIQKRLRRYPVSEDVWEQYHQDQEINDRGIAIDRQLVESAIRMDMRSRAELTEQMQKLTCLENPNSVQQMKKWLAEHDVLTESLGKKQVAALLKDCPEDLREVLILRQQLAKSSVKKYIAMRNAACADGRVRGAFQFYGANRSGRWAGRNV